MSFIRNFTVCRIKDDLLMGKNKGLYMGLCCLPLLLALAAFSSGRYPISPEIAGHILLSPLTGEAPFWPSAAENVIFQLRLPRILAAMLIGAGLASSGAAFQGVFRNPLVSPYILGIASGAGFGAALAILLTDSAWMVQISALFFGILAVLAAYSFSLVYKTAPTLVLILGGIVTGAFFSAMISLIKFVADPYEKLPAIVFWLMGSLAQINTDLMVRPALVLMLALCLLVLLGWRINLLSMGENEARSFGVHTKRDRALLIFLCTLITASATCLAGIIGWVGLVIPHIGRLLVGPDNRKLLPACMSLGASYLLLVDTLSRTLTETEIPLGILTASLGAPFFAYLMLRRKVRW